MVSSVFFRDMRVSLEAIGLTSLFGVPWVIKFLWGPVIDQFGTKRKWILIMQFLLVLLFIIVAFMSPLPYGIKLIAGLFFIGALLSATHDIAIDGYYMEALDKEGQAKFVGYRVMAYRLAMMAGTGIIVTIGATAGWFAAFFAGGAFLGILFVYHVFFLPDVEEEKIKIHTLLKRVFRIKFLIAGITLVLILWGMRSFFWERLSGKVITLLPFLQSISLAGWVAIGLLILLIGLGIFKNRIKELFFRDKESFYSRAFFDYMDRDKMAVAIAFIILMRTGESALSSMVAPFMVDLGIKVHYGWLSGGVGLPFSIIGAPFLLVQNLTNVIYMGLALSLAKYITVNTGADVVIFIGHFNLFLVACVHAFDQFAGGLGTAVLITFLMRTCLEQFKAAHFAIGTGLMNISGVLAGVARIFFGISFLLSIPGMCLIFFIPFLDTKDQIDDKQLK
jgi:PAT family beta-lactamase induction signal transducer AmpG